MKKQDFLTKVVRYYDSKLQQHGPVAEGVDWNGASSQKKRFEQLMKIFDERIFFTVNDLGCGYGEFYRYLSKNRRCFEYEGVDVSANMIETAKRLFAGRRNCRFICGTAKNLKKMNYTVASGIFNVKLGQSQRSWEKYIFETLVNMNAASQRGFAFNLLTRYCDRKVDHQKLYYADPCFYFDFCKQKFAKNVALLHDYELYEFTVLVRK